MSNDFYQSLLRLDNLYSAWRHVKKKSRKSPNKDIRDAAEDFESYVHKRLKSIQGKLVARTYAFPPVKGVLKDKKKRKMEGKPPRPIVLSTLEGRVVQRAILQVLQPNSNLSNLVKKLGKIKNVNESPYGIGGNPSGGASVALKSVLKDMNEGFRCFFKSDIKAFYTRIKNKEVTDFIYKETHDDEISQIFSDALNVEVSNKNELAKYFDLFPQKGIGVPQGSSLSAFAGNVLLYELDLQLNSKGTRSYRYIDDVIILGKTNQAVHDARVFCIEWLRKKNMSLYNPAQDPNKAEQGNVKKGFSYLGCKVFPNHIEPSKRAKQRLINKVKKEIKIGKEYIKSACNNISQKRQAQSAYIQVLARIDRIIYGWGQTFSFCNVRLPFKHLDEKISEDIDRFERWYFKRKNNLSAMLQRRTLGIAFLQDIKCTYADISSSTSMLPKE